MRSSPETCTLPCVKQIASGNLVYAAGTHTSYIIHTSYNTCRCSVTDQRGETGREVGGMLKRDGTYAYLWLTHVDAWQKPTQYCKRNYPPIKNK